MAEAPARRSALDGVWQPGRFGAGSGAAALSFALLRDRLLVEFCLHAPLTAELHGAIAPLAGVDLPAPRAVAHGALATLVWVGPQRFWALGDGADAGAWLARWSDALDGQAWLTDLSHARTGLRIGGEAALELLAAGCRIDLERLGASGAAGTLFGAIPVQLHGLGGARRGFDLYVARSHARSLWHLLGVAAGEFGYQVAP